MKLSEWKDKLYNSESIIVYGAGNYGKVAAAYLSADNILSSKILAIAVTEKSEEEAIQNISVREIRELEMYSKDKDVMVLIAVAEDKRKAIRDTLSVYGFDNVYHMDKQLLLYMKGILEKKEQLQEQLQNTLKRITNVEKKIDDLLYGINLDRVMAESSWLKKKDFSAGRSAVNNMYLYFMYKILDSGRFHSILDIGMGQTSKMIGQYVKVNTEATHYIIEDDKEWIDFCAPMLELGDNSIIYQMDYVQKDYKGEKVRVYDGFKNRLDGYKFDYLSIDAPIGYDMKQYSRIDILSILPHCLKENWIIMIDDIDRIGEYNTFEEIKSILTKNEIDYVANIYPGGDKAFGIITSGDNKFFCTI